MTQPCPVCFSPLGFGVEYCAACGHAAAHPAAMLPVVEGPSLEICPGCGVIAPEQRSSCEVCGTDYPSPRPRAPRLLEERLFWVAVRAHFKCRSCGHVVPLNHLDMDGSVLCVACGTDQAFKARGWTRPLKHAHGVGDLSGPEPEGRFPNPGLPIGAHNPFASLGVSETWAISRQQGASVGASSSHESLELEAAPGHPLCERCRSPLAIRARSAESITLGCPACDAPETNYPIPSQAGGAVAGVLTPEHSSGQRNIELLFDAGGAVAVRCPNCSAPLELSGVCTVVTCRFCAVTSRLPGEVLLKLGFKSVKPLVWWLLFQGPSSRRTEAEQLARRAEKHAARDAQRRATPPPANAGKRKKPDVGLWTSLFMVGVALLTLLGIVLVATGKF